MTSVPPPRWRPVLPHLDWRPKVRWFAAEYLVVVAGVLTAVALNAAWQARSDRAAERAYLEQLAADLRMNEEYGAYIDSTHAPVERAGVQLIAAFYSVDPPPPDSLAVWFTRAMRYHTYTPITGTARALVSTGDIGLIRNDSLRATVVDYLEVAEGMNSSTEKFVEEWSQGSNSLLERYSFVEAMAAVRTAAELDSLSRARPQRYYPMAPYRPRAPLDAEAFLADRQALVDLQQMSVAAWNVAEMRSGLAEGSRAFRERIEAELAR